MGRPRPADLRPRPIALRSVGAGEASDAVLKGPLRAVASSGVGAAYEEEEEVENAATATLRELEATAGPEPSCRNAQKDDLDANAILRCSEWSR